MKKKALIFIALLATSFSYAQSIRVYNWDFKNGSEAEVGKIFEQYFDRERNSGSAILQRVRFLDNVTHRVLLTGDPANWGSKEETSDVEWDAFLRGMWMHQQSKAPGSYTGKSLAWKEGDREKNNVGQMWMMKVADSKKYLAAHNKFVKQTADIIGDRSIGFGKLNMGRNGATHYAVFYGDNLSDVELTMDKIRASKAYEELVENRGEAEVLNSYMVNTLMILE